MQMVHFPRYKKKTALIVIDLNITLVKKKKYAIMISFNSLNLCSKEQVTAKSTIQVRKRYSVIRSVNDTISAK